MNYLEYKNKIYEYDPITDITLVFNNNAWKISEISIHELERLEDKNIYYLTKSEVDIKTKGISSELLKIEINNILKGKK